MFDHGEDHGSVALDHAWTAKTIDDERLIRADLAEHACQQREQNKSGENTETYDNKVSVRHKAFFHSASEPLAATTVLAAPLNPVVFRVPYCAMPVHRRCLAHIATPPPRNRARWRCHLLSGQAKTGGRRVGCK